MERFDNKRPKVRSMDFFFVIRSRPVSKFQIRAHDLGDIETLKSITIASFGDVSIDANLERLWGPIGSHDWRWRKARSIDDDCQAEGAAVFVAVIDTQELAGYVTTRIDQEARVGFIPNLAVRAKYQGHGIGRALLEHALDHFRQAGMQVARIETLEQNPIGQHLYPQLGFVEVARQIHYAVRLDPANREGSPR
jgi:ribosomal protein S18 acetylase RimI-like enzyme